MNGPNKRKAAETGRRNFVKLCMSTIALGLQKPALSADSVAHKYNRSRLTDASGKSIDPRTLVAGENYIFHYPFVTTPCFLINLGQPARETVVLKTENNDSYHWRGGVGPTESIVAFSAICAHKMTHPAKSVSFINYRHEKAYYTGKDSERRQDSHIIYCCSEGSVYDARRGADVLGGPAKQPLATVLLEFDPEDNQLFATGMAGGELFDRFFRTFTDRLQLEYLRTDIQHKTNEHTEVMPLRMFSQTQKLC